MIYDIVYMHQDLKNDLKVGVKSLAVLHYGYVKMLLWQRLSLMTALLLVYSWLSEMGALYDSLGASGATMSLCMMIMKVDLSSIESCWWWFRKGFWVAGGSIAGGLLAEYVPVWEPPTAINYARLLSS